MRLLIAGFLVGLVAGLAALVLIRPVNHTIVPSLSTVDELGRNETFEIVLPDDRLYLAGAGVPVEAAVPAGRSIDAGRLAAVRAEVFQLRDGRDRVIGVASRLSGSADSDWVLYVPARGALFLRDGGGDPAAADGAVGRVLGGTESFAGETGQFRRTTRVDADGRRLRFETAVQAIEP